LDRWFRKKYNIPYLSEVHRESTFYSIYFEYYEELMYKEYLESKDVLDEKEKFIYTPLSGRWWKGIELTSTEIEDWFNTPI
jgi:L-rhamnose mutarotase